MQEMLQAVEPTYRMVSQNARALQGIVDNLGKQLDSVRQHMYLHSALLAPANRCPIEILHEIFKLYFQEYDTSSDTPFVLAAVSTYWRQVIISLPWLWAKVQIQVDIQTFSPRVIEGLSTWLGRAGSTHPLSLRIVFVRKCTINWRSRDDSDWLTEDILENRDASFLFDILRRYSLRWHKLEFIRCPPNVLQVLSGVMGDSVPNLRSLMIDGLEWTASFTHELPHSFPKWLLPKGSHLSLSRDRFLSLHMTSVFQLSNVRSLTLADCTSIMNNRLLLSEFLSHCTSLETCKLRCTAKLDHGTVTLFRTLPSLLDLSVEMETPDKMLHFMILPRLRRLKLSFLEKAYFSSNLRFVQELFGRSRLVHLSGSFNPSPDGVYEFNTIPSTMALKGK
ncbi:hypothetical protein BT96DRAFT_293602 [Gymnopus androsaceus JB14]|uniref:F-box domain-containing protein n=1 Tax=Gymnopus androsaceus JB14 TaxID=1447944 RepID=A0A6A4I7M7_9AGAR|nr:hypothetical protein BT96DRAFT_293602 [Gymnopus androsaceus JB14]